MSVPGSTELDTSATVGLATSFTGLSGLLTWAVPSLVMTVPGLLVLTVGAQLAGGLAWLPLVRRNLGAFGLRRRRRRRPADQTA